MAVRFIPATPSRPLAAAVLRLHTDEAADKSSEKHCEELLTTGYMDAVEICNDAGKKVWFMLDRIASGAGRPLLERRLPVAAPPRKRVRHADPEPTRALPGGATIEAAAASYISAPEAHATEPVATFDPKSKVNPHVLGTIMRARAIYKTHTNTTLHLASLLKNEDQTEAFVSYVVALLVVSTHETGRGQHYASDRKRDIINADMAFYTFRDAMRRRV